MGRVAANACRSRHRELPRALLLLGGAVATLGLCGTSSFINSSPGISRGGRSVQQKRLQQRAEKAGGYEYIPIDWLVDFGVKDEELEAVINRVTSVDQIWPDPSVSLTREDFRERVKGGGGGGGFFGGGSATTELDDRAIDSVFNTLSSSFIIVPDFRNQVTEKIKEWKSGEKVNKVAVQAGIFGARLSILGAYLFLRVFSAYAGYFVIGRPLLYQATGIDLLPNLKRFWETS